MPFAFFQIPHCVRLLQLQNDPVLAGRIRQTDLVRLLLRGREQRHRGGVPREVQGGEGVVVGNLAQLGALDEVIFPIQHAVAEGVLVVVPRVAWRDKEPD